MKISRLLMSGVLMLSTLAGMAQQPVIHRYKLDHGGFFSNMSRNGHWAVGNPAAGDVYNKIDVVDVINGKVINLPVNKFYGKDGAEVSSVPTIAAVYAGAVNNDGTIVGGSVNGEPGYWQDNAWHQLPFPNDRRSQKYFGYEAEVQNMRADGKYFVGMAYDASFDIKPLLWIDGELVDLPNLPKYDWKGYEIDADVDAANMRFIDITEDGKYLLGGMSTNHPGWGSCYFLYNLETDKWFFLGVEDLTDMIQSGEYSDKSELSGDEMPRFSPNGKYIAGNVLLAKVNKNSDFPTDEHRPWLYDVENDEFKIYMEDFDENKLVTGVTNEGNIIASSSFTQAVTSVQFRTESMWIDVESILAQSYGVDITSVAGIASTGVSFGVSEDCKILLGMPQPCRSDGYSVELKDKTFLEAAKGVNLMNSYRVYPTAGSAITTIDGVMVRFNRPSEVAENASAVIKDGDKVIATSTTIEPNNTDKILWVINFEPTNFEEGKTYTVEVAEGSFYLPQDESMKNEEIKISYTGKKNAPVGLENISPASGTAIPELGVENMVRLRFNSPVQIAANAVGRLYQKGASSPLCNVILSADGNYVYAYPAATRKLMLGTDYELIIPSGSVVDITGYCPSEEITVTYSGTSELTTPEPGSAYLFNDNFDDPNKSLTGMMQYEGDHNTPTSAMTSLGFDADNTPWNFSVRQNSESTDYVAASHSSYTNGGKSDDWLVLPQLSISNPYIFLCFDGQSYKKAAKDRLKVLVWSSDESFSSLDAEIVERMRNEGEVIFDRQLNPGKDEDIFDGDWEHFEIPLEKYSGSKIYIAFINENENQSAIFLNDLNVVYKGNFQITADYSENVVNADNTQIRAYINVLNDEVYRSFSAKLVAGDFESTYTNNSVHIEKGKPFGFHFPENLPLVKGETTDFYIEITMGEETQTVSGSVNDLLKHYFRRVVLEEGTGAWCGNCPFGMLAIEDMEKIYGDRFIPISIHNGDEYAYPAYESFLGFTAFPTGRVDRLPDYLQANNGTSFYKDGKTTFHDVVSARMDAPAMLDTWVTDVNKNADNTELSIVTNTVFGLSMTDKHYNVLAVLTEDGLEGVQTNYLSGSTEPIVGEWGSRGAHCDAIYADVARGISGSSFYGEGGAIPTDIVAGDTYSHTIKMNVPNSVKDLEKCRITTMVIDPTTGYILNAFRTGRLDAGVGEISAESSRLIIAFADGSFLANGSAEGVEVYNLAGMKVNNHSLMKGIYIVVAKNAKGEQVKAKMMVK